MDADHWRSQGESFAGRIRLGTLLKRVPRWPGKRYQPEKAVICRGIECRGQRGDGVRIECALTHGELSSTCSMCTKRQRTAQQRKGRGKERTREKPLLPLGMAVSQTLNPSFRRHCWWASISALHCSLSGPCRATHSSRAFCIGGIGGTIARG